MNPKAFATPEQIQASALRFSNAASNALQMILRGHHNAAREVVNVARFEGEELIQLLNDEIPNVVACAVCGDKYRVDRTGPGAFVCSPECDAELDRRIDADQRYAVMRREMSEADEEGA